MPPPSLVQHNLYKGLNPRCWIRLRFAAADGSLHERELIADTGCPSAVVLGLADLAFLMNRPAPGRGSNFGQLMGGWLDISMPELGLSLTVLGFGNNNVWQQVQQQSPDFAGLAGLPFLRLVEYGGDSTAFWLAKPAGTP